MPPDTVTLSFLIVGTRVSACQRLSPQIYEASQHHQPLGCHCRAKGAKRRLCAHHSAVIAGLDPAIHEASQVIQLREFWICAASWMRGSSPRMTSDVDARHKAGHDAIWPASARPDPGDVTHLASRASVAFAVDVHGGPGNSEPARRVIN